MRYGRIIKELRVSAKLSQAELAKLAGVSQSSISKVERAETPNGAASADTLTEIAAALKTTATDIRLEWEGVATGTEPSVVNVVEQPSATRQRSYAELTEAMKLAIGEVFDSTRFSVDDIAIVTQCAGDVVVDASDNYLKQMATVFLKAAALMRHYDIRVTAKAFMLSVAMVAVDKNVV